MTLLDVDTFTFTEEEVELPDICESQHCEEVLKRPAHEAQHYGHFPCRWFLYAICHERAIEYADQRRVICNCGEVVDGLSITVTDIPKRGA